MLFRWRARIGAVAVAAMLLVVGAASPGVAASRYTSRTNVSFTSRGVTSKGHIFAAHLDWSKPVGIMVYLDGSSERGLRGYNSSYLLDADGKTGLVEAARRRNLLLVTPFAPGSGCDGAGRTETCWSWPSGRMTVAKKTQWAYDFVQWVRRQYPAANGRFVLGGYSSGARATTEFLGPKFGEKMSVDLMVAISLGGPPRMGPNYSAAFKAHTPIVWNVGARDAFLSQPKYGVRRGHDWYKAAGFRTALTVVPDLGHSRSDFDTVIAQSVDHYLPAR
jgi:predicted esterase